METNIDETTNDELDGSDDYIVAVQLALPDDDSEIDGDCNESQPCRGDESGLTQDLTEDVD
jgi:hypothetical protein